MPEFLFLKAVLEQVVHSSLMYDLILCCLSDLISYHCPTTTLLQPHDPLFLESVKYIPALGLWHLVCSLMAMLFPQYLRGCLPHSFRSLLRCHLSERISLTVLYKIASAPYPTIFYPFLYFTFPDCIATIYLLYAYV